jgi:hypothetical protein
MRRVTFPSVLLLTALSFGCGAREKPSTASEKPSTEGTGLETRTIPAGEVTVKIDPVAIDDDGASFEITLDTHSVALDMDVAESASLLVGGKPWTGTRWQGDGPGGHHREGTLTFETGGPADGTARLELEGFPEPVRATWDL